MSCRDEIKKHLKLDKIRELAIKAAKMESRIYIIFEKEDGTFGFQAEGLEYNGKFYELIYP